MTIFKDFSAHFRCSWSESSNLVQGPRRWRLPRLAVEEERWNGSDGRTMGQVLVCSSQQEPLLLQGSRGCHILVVASISVLPELVTVVQNGSSVVGESF